MLRKLSLFLLTVVCSFSLSMLAVSAAEMTKTGMADSLKEMGLFLGGSNGYDLERAPTRAEASVMLIRLLGKESVAKQENATHPFTDVPSWASPYVGYMYKNGLTSGIGKNLFGSVQLASPQQFSTFLLRAVGYDDTKGDFAYATAMDKAVTVGVLSAGQKAELASAGFLRGDMVEMAYQTLSVSVKTGEKTLLQELVSNKAVTDLAADHSGLLPTTVPVVAPASPPAPTPQPTTAPVAVPAENELTYDELGESFPATNFIPIVSDKKIEFTTATITLSSEMVKVKYSPDAELIDSLSVRAAVSQIVGYSGTVNVVISSMGSTAGAPSGLVFQKYYQGSKPWFKTPSQLGAAGIQAGCIGNSNDFGYMVRAYDETDHLIGIAVIKAVMGTYQNVVLLTNPDEL